VPLIVTLRAARRAHVINKWSNELLFDELLAQHGFAVLHTDNRGMGGRGRAFARPLITTSARSNWKISDRGGRPLWRSIRNWTPSAGLVGMELGGTSRSTPCRTPTASRRGFRGSCDRLARLRLDLYQRYMSEPAEFASGYKDFSVVNSAASLKGRLLLAHAPATTTCTWNNPWQFVQKLIEAKFLRPATLSAQNALHRWSRCADAFVQSHPGAL